MENRAASLLQTAPCQVQSIQGILNDYSTATKYYGESLPHVHGQLHAAFYQQQAVAQHTETACVLLSQPVAQCHTQELRAGLYHSSPQAALLLQRVLKCWGLIHCVQ